MTDSDITMFWACVQAGIVCLVVAAVMLVWGVVREWWREKK